MMGYYGGYGFFGGIWMILVWIGIIWLIVWLVRNLKQDSKTSEAQPIEILKKRYAKGEMTKQEFEDMKKDIL